MFESQNMFCDQCEQSAPGGCVLAGVCGKDEELAAAQDRLTAALISFASAEDGKHQAAEVSALVREGLFATMTNVNFNRSSIDDLTERVQVLSAATMFDMRRIWLEPDPNLRSAKSLVLFGLRGLAAYAYHAQQLGRISSTVDAFVIHALHLLGEPDQPLEDLLDLALEVGKHNLTVMGMLDQENNEHFGMPEPTPVPLTVEPGPFIVVSGHDLLDLKLLLEQTRDSGVSVYTHGEMLPALAYPEFKKYPQLKGHFGTAWQNQQREFDGIPGALLFTTNCLVPPLASYADRLFTTSVVEYPGCVHIGKDKDFSAVIAKARELGGYQEPRSGRGMNGGTEMTCGYAQGTVLALAPRIIEAVKGGKIGHFFLVGGCDGGSLGRNYYTDFAKLTPADSIILTLGCGKFRVNDLELGQIGDFPRIMDMGQCNDSYSAIQVALALAQAFDCDVNQLPLTLVLSWFEQKAVVVLLTLLSLNIKNILLGPSLPGFVSPDILAFLVEHFALTPITTPAEDLKRILG
ncbi:MAG: hydroxylamine reductase [Coriobacteriales bacterium]|jgi:hydroxylamine reductase|nr:hydroxylamine reductase [Coriobacteriales bacterium]